MSNEPVIVASENGAIGLGAGIEILRRGGSALDAIEAACLPVELNREDQSVGVGGIPNMLGEVELDAGIMDGARRAAGAVCALRGFEHPVAIARAVLERLPHVLLAGEGAARFAAEHGFARIAHATPEALARWQERLEERRLWPVDPARLTEACRGALREERWGGTVNFLARDAAGHLAVAVSTSGIGWKYPGRVGDSPIPGAGYYADNRYGAAACTGRGELSLQSGTALRAILALAEGRTPADAGRAAMAQLALIHDGWGGGMNLLILDRHGAHAAFSSAAGRHYAYQTAAMPQWLLAPREQVDIGQG